MSKPSLTELAAVTAVGLGALPAVQPKPPDSRRGRSEARGPTGRE